MVNSENQIAVELNEFRKPFLAFIRNRIKDSQLAQDIFQEVTIKVILKIKEGKIEILGSPKSYFFKCLKNECINHIKKNHSPIHFDPTDSHEGLLGVIEPREGHYDDFLDFYFTNIQSQAKTDKAINIFDMHYVQDYSYKEISSKLKIKKNSIGPTIKRAKNIIKARFQIHVENLKIERK